MTTIINYCGAEACLYLRDDHAALGNVKVESSDDLENLIDKVARAAQSLGQDRLIAPLNGDTWHSYRTITYSSGEAKFFLEPQSALSSDLLISCGFENIAQYSSSQIDLLASQEAIAAALSKRQSIIERSFIVRPFDSANFANELKAIFALSLRSFQSNFLYQAISLDDFAELYTPLAGLIKDELVWLAFSKSELVGLLFALPDQCNKGQLILKTVAVDPAYNGIGLASYLLSRVHTEALKLGFTKSIQALYKDENKSAVLTSKLSSKVIRRYGLFALNLNTYCKQKGH